MSKKALIVIVVVIAAVFLVVRVVGKRGIEQVTAEERRPAAETHAGSPESKSKPVASGPSTPENLPKLR